MLLPLPYEHRAITTLSQIRSSVAKFQVLLGAQNESSIFDHVQGNPMKSSSYFVHPQALVETESIGEGTRVWAFAHVMQGASDRP